MKNRIAILVATITSLVLISPASATLYSYYGGHLPSISERVGLANSCGIKGYTGTKQQNIQLENCLASNGSLGAPKLGAALPIVGPLIETSLQASIDTVATSMTLVSGVDRAGNTLTGYVCLTIDSGTPVAEYVCGNASSTVVTGLMRGIDPITGNTSNPSLIFNHRRGADVRETDFPTITLLTRMLSGLETTPGGLLFSTNTISGLSIATSTATSSAASIAYVNQGLAAGCVKAGVGVEGCVEEALPTSFAATGPAASRQYINPVNSVTSSAGVGSGSLVVRLRASDGKLDNSLGGSASSLATLNASSLVVQNPNSATSTPAANSIPIADANGQLDDSWAKPSRLVVQYYTLGQTVSSSVPVPMYLNLSDGKIYQTSASTASTTVFNFIGFDSGYGLTSPTSTVVPVVQSGIIYNFSGLSIGSTYYLANAAGTISVTPGTITYSVGVAVTATSLKMLSDAPISQASAGNDKFISTASFSNTGTVNGTLSSTATTTIPYGATYAYIDGNATGDANGAASNIIEFTGAYLDSHTSGQSICFGTAGGACNMLAHMTWSGGIVSVYFQDKTNDVNGHANPGSAGGNVYFYR